MQVATAFSKKFINQPAGREILDEDSRLYTDLLDFKIDPSLTEMQYIQLKSTGNNIYGYRLVDHLQRKMKLGPSIDDLATRSPNPLVYYIGSNEVQCNCQVLVKLIWALGWQYLYVFPVDDYWEWLRTPGCSGGQDFIDMLESIDERLLVFHNKKNIFVMSDNEVTDSLLRLNVV